MLWAAGYITWVHAFYVPYYRDWANFVHTGIWAGVCYQCAVLVGAVLWARHRV